MLIVLQSKASPDVSNWSTYTVEQVPVSRRVRIRLVGHGQDAGPQVSTLMAALESLIKRVGGRWEKQPQTNLVDPDPSIGDLVLEVLVCTDRAVLEDRVAGVLAEPENSVLPVMQAQSSPGTLLPAELRRQNVGFWKSAIEELAATILARAAVTSLDRRVFISYRRAETAPMADQLFEELERRNFSVFLDTVRIDPGVNFQERLFEQLSDKSMVLLLNSPTFSHSQWTMAEVDYARAHDLSVLILRLPDETFESAGATDQLSMRYRAGDIIRLKNNEVLRSGNTWQLDKAALQSVLDHITDFHDREMVNRVRNVQERMKEALDEQSVQWRQADNGYHINVTSEDRKHRYSLFPSSRPPWLESLYETSTRPVAADIHDSRIVVGRVSAFNELRMRQLDWTVLDRNVVCVDISLMPVLARELKRGAL